MTLPPLANLFAAHDPDPLRLADLAADLEASGEFAAVWRPAPGWVAAAAPLPGGPADQFEGRHRALAFAEGHAGDGDAGFVRFDPDSVATVTRSCGGLVPFYLWQSGSRIAAATRLGDFVRFLPDEPQVDPLVNAVWTTGHGLFPDGRTFLAGVRLLDRGCRARLVPGRPITTERYWDPRPRSLPRSTPARAREHAERLRTLLLEKLARDLDPEGGNLLTLSGGVDSTSLAALATRVLGRPVCTWSLLPDPEDRYQHEMSYIAPLLEQCGIERSWVVRLGAETRLALLRAAPQVVFHVIHPALCALPGILREAPVRVLFGGEFADEVCGSAFTWPDWVTHTSIVDLLAHPRSLPTGPRDLLRWAKRRVLSAVGRPVLPFPPDLPEFIRPEVREEYRTWLDQRGRRAAQGQEPRAHLALRAEADGFVAMNWEAASALGVRRSFPFFNCEVLELAFECHPAELVGPGTKKLLRTALRGDVQARNLDRPDKGHWGTYLQGAQIPWAERLPEGLEPVVRDDWYPQPPRALGLGEAHALAQLVLFVESLRARQLARSVNRGRALTTAV